MGVQGEPHEAFVLVGNTVRCGWGGVGTLGWGGSCELATGEGSSDSKAGLPLHVGGTWHREAPAGRAFGQGQWLETSLCLPGAGIRADRVLISAGKALCKRRAVWLLQEGSVVVPGSGHGGTLGEHHSFGLEVSLPLSCF